MTAGSTNHLIGAHVSAAGGYLNALENIRAIGGNCLQMFSASPRTWQSPKIDPGYASRFRDQVKEQNIGPIYFHSPYLINLASQELTGDKSERFLIDELSAAAKIGARGSIVHLGSFKKAGGEEKKNQYDLMISRIKNILAKTPEETHLIIENSATRKIGQTIEEIAEIVKDVSDPRLKICLDTCHLHAAGYNINDKKSFNDFFDKFDKLIPLTRLELIHANDSRDEFGSLRDRHENIGDGKLGRNVFKNLFNDARTSRLPFIAEVPGIDGLGSDAENIGRLEKIALNAELDNY